MLFTMVFSIDLKNLYFIYIRSTPILTAFFAFFAIVKNAKKHTTILEKIAPKQ